MEDWAPRHRVCLGSEHRKYYRPSFLFFFRETEWSRISLKPQVPLRFNDCSMCQIIAMINRFSSIFFINFVGLYSWDLPSPPAWNAWRNEPGRRDTGYYIRVCNWIFPPLGQAGPGWLLPRGAIVCSHVFHAWESSMVPWEEPEKRCVEIVAVVTRISVWYRGWMSRNRGYFR